MPLTTESESPPARAESDSNAPESGYDVVNSAASPKLRNRQQRLDRYLLFNFAIPVLLVLAGALVIKLLGSAKAAPTPPKEITVASVLEALPTARVEKIQTLAQTGRRLELVIDGTVVPFREARVSSEVAGRVIFKSQNCEAGSIVKEGEVLMRIDPTDYELEVQRLTRQREQEYRALGEIDQEMANTKRSIDVARQDVKLKQKEVDRQASLQRFGSQAEMDQAKSGLLQASQALVTLENQLDLLRSRRSRLEASEQLAATQLRVAEVNLERCEIRAPISGVIVSEQADLNTFVNRGTALLTIEDTNKVEVASNMRMDQLQWVLDQRPDVQQTGYDLPETDAIIEYQVAGRQSKVQRWKGKLVSYDGIGIDPNTRTVPVRLLVDDPTHFVDQDGKRREAKRTSALLRGMFVQVRLLIEPKSGLVVIPARALRPGNKVWQFTPDDSMIAKRMAEAQAARAEAEQESAESAGDGEPPAKGDGSGDKQDKADAFDPSGWSAGLVQYSTTVYPIDTLRLNAPRAIDPNISPAIRSAEREWVCEVGDSDLAGGDYVVVSPLDSIPPSGLPVRAKLNP